MFDSESYFVAFLMAVAFVLGLFLGVIADIEIDIQDIKEVDGGYYITINNEIYYKE